MEFYDSSVRKSDLLSFFTDAEKISNLNFREDLRFTTDFVQCHSEDVLNSAMAEICEKCSWINDGEAEIKELCYNLSKKIQAYLHDLPDVRAEAFAIYNKWLKIDKEKELAEKKLEEGRARLVRAKDECYSCLNNKVQCARDDISKFKADCFRRDLRSFIAKSFADKPDITGKEIARLANKSGLFSNRYITPQKIYSEWNDVRKAVKDYSFGDNYPDNIEINGTFMDAVKKYNVVQDTDLSGLLKTNLTIYDVINMLDNNKNGFTSTLRSVISSDDLAYENFLEPDPDCDDIDEDEVLDDDVTPPFYDEDDDCFDEEYDECDDV